MDIKINAFIEINDGFLLAGYYYSSENRWDGLVMKVDKSGELVWKKFMVVIKEMSSIL